MLGWALGPNPCPQGFPVLWERQTPDTITPCLRGSCRAWWALRGPAYPRETEGGTKELPQRSEVGPSVSGALHPSYKLGVIVVPILQVSKLSGTSQA